MAAGGGELDGRKNYLLMLLRSCKGFEFCRETLHSLAMSSKGFAIERKVSRVNTKALTSYYYFLFFPPPSPFRSSVVALKPTKVVLNVIYKYIELKFN